MTQNPFADLFKNFADVSKMPQIDLTGSLSSVRRNVEAANTASQALAEGLQAASRRTAEIVRDNAETALKASRDFLTSGTPDMNVTKQAAYAKDAFESNLSNVREIYEMLAKSGAEAFDVISKRAAESIEEASEQVASTTSTTKKKKAA